MPTDLSPWREPEQPEDDAFLHSFAGKLEGADVFRRLVMACMPARTYGDLRHVRGSFHRMVAIVYRVAPETFDGMAAREVAATLGISYRAFKTQLAEADDILGRQRASRRARQ